MGLMAIMGVLLIVSLTHGGTRRIFVGPQELFYATILLVVMAEVVVRIEARWRRRRSRR